MEKINGIGIHKNTPYKMPSIIQENMVHYIYLKGLIILKIKW